MGFFDWFPYTNFHNVNLDWVLQRVKEWGKLVEANDTAFHNLEDANASFKLYVENYLADLNVQAQIDDKLDRMFESGELTDYLQPYVSDTVTNWLDENITEPTGVVIDSSLTVSGACADAKATGNAIQEVALSTIAREAILECFQKVAWMDGTSNESYNKLQRALYNWGENLLYKLVNVPVSFNGTNIINSGFSLWLENYSFTIFVEYIDNTNHFNDTENKMLFRQYRTNPFCALYFQSWNGGAVDSTNAKVINGFRFTVVSTDINIRWEYTENKNNISHAINRFVLIYDSNTHSVNVGFSHNGTILNASSSSGDLNNVEFIEMQEENALVLGGLIAGMTRLFKGVINDFTIYKEAVTTERMNNYLMGVVE